MLNLPALYKKSGGTTAGAITLAVGLPLHGANFFIHIGGQRSALKGQGLKGIGGFALKGEHTHHG